MMQAAAQGCRFCSQAYATDLLLCQRVAACVRPGLAVACTPRRRRHSQRMPRLSGSRLHIRLSVSPSDAAAGAGRRLSHHEALRPGRRWVLRGLVIAV
jgi:hypothetical protein